MSLIQHEIKQRLPFPTPAQEAVVGLIRTVDVLRRTLAAVVEPAGITLQQYNVLRILRGAGRDGIPTLEIAARMIEQTPGITRLLDRLERKALARRARCPRDRRQVLCTITPGGAHLLGRLDRPMTAASASFCRPLDDGGTIHLVRLLDAVRAALPAARSDRIPVPIRRKNKEMTKK